MIAGINKVTLQMKEQLWRQQHDGITKLLEEERKKAENLLKYLRGLKVRTPSPKELEDNWEWTEAQIKATNPDLSLAALMSDRASKGDIALIENQDTRFLTEHIKLLIEAVEHFQHPDGSWEKKEVIMDHFLQKTLSNGQQISKAQASMMATFCRPPEAMIGGNKARKRRG